MNKQQAKEKIKGLVADYENLKKSDALNDKNEAFTKQRFIQPFFEALGWDFRRDVWPEEKVSKDRVDFAFKIGDFTKFFLEAKKFSVDINEERWAKQAIEYAWNKAVSWAILTDFEGLKIFNSEWNQKPYRAVKEFKYDDYLEKFDEIWFLSKESIQKGELDRSAEAWGVKEKKVPVTEQLAEDLTEWRRQLTDEIKGWNEEKFSDEEIDEAVQRFLDRLIFIRYTEDKDLEPRRLEPILREYKKLGGDLIQKLNRIFREFDNWYDSRLFEKHFSEEMEAYSGNLKDLLEGLYRSIDSDHPYDFSAISVDILGAVYEQYLGYLQKKDVTKQGAKRKKQGIYYTPNFVVDYIAQNTVGAFLKENGKDDIRSIKILDPACGSGSFLIKSYQLLEDYYQNLANFKFDTKSQLGKFEKTMLDKKGLKEISAAQKASILRENIYGADLDPKAVEIAQLNLLLKAITRRTKLPNLSHNIVCGNSLIPEGDKKFKPLNWKEEFKKVFANGGFDVIIGNPPYIKEDTNRLAFDGLHDSPYYQGKMDIWTMFACKAIDLLKDSGYFSFIAPSSWLGNAGASIFRDKILSEGEILKFVDFGDWKVFKDASIQTMIFVFQKRKPRKSYKTLCLKIDDKNLSIDTIAKILVSDLTEKVEGVTIYETKITLSELTGKPIVFVDSGTDQILEKIEKASNFKLGEDDIGNGIDVLQDFVTGKHLLKIKDGSVKKGDGVFILKNSVVDSLKLNDMERSYLKPYYTPQQINKYIGLKGKNEYKIIYADKYFRENINLFPNLKQHIDKFTPILTSAFAPYGLHRPRDERFFNGEGVFVLRKTLFPTCAYVDFPCYVTRAFLILKPADINLKYLTGLLNSKLIYFWLKHKGKKQGEQLQIDKEPLLGVPLIKTTSKNEKRIVQKVNFLFKLQKQLFGLTKNSDKWNKTRGEIKKAENEIDLFVYKLYGLTPEEIKIVEDSNKK